MGVAGFRLDIFVIIWFISMGMVNFIDSTDHILNIQREGKYNITEIADWQGVTVGLENESAYDFGEPRAQPSETSFNFLDTFIYGYKAFTFFTGVLWSASFGFHTWLRDSFGIPYMPWGLPLMILINLVNFLGLVELWTKIKAW